MPLDIEQLRTDPVYWDRYAPAEATHVGHDAHENRHCFYRINLETPNEYEFLYETAPPETTWTINRGLPAHGPLIPRPIAEETPRAHPQHGDYIPGELITSEALLEQIRATATDQNDAMALWENRNGWDGGLIYLVDHWCWANSFHSQRRQDMTPDRFTSQPVEAAPFDYDRLRTDPDYWSQWAPAGATHFDNSIDRFCTANGYWGYDNEFISWGMDRTTHLSLALQFIPRPSSTTFLYRYVDAPDGHPHAIELQLWHVVKITPKGYWVHQTPILVRDKTKNLRQRGCKWVSHGTKFAHATKYAAWRSYRIRKKQHLQHLKRRVQNVKSSLVVLNTHRQEPPNDLSQFRRPHVPEEIEW